MAKIKLSTKTALALSLALSASPAWANGGACVVKNATTIRASGLIEEYSLYSSAMEKSASAVFKYLKDPNYSLGGPLDLANAAKGGAVGTSSKGVTLGTQSTIREVASEMEKKSPRTNKGSL